jgi:hypothetical protein
LRLAGVLAKYSRDLTSLAADGKLDHFQQLYLATSYQSMLLSCLSSAGALCYYLPSTATVALAMTRVTFVAMYAGVLAKYSRDLTSLAAEGKLDPVIGRHDEMRRLIDVLCRRTKNRCGCLSERVALVGNKCVQHALSQEW